MSVDHQREHCVYAHRRETDGSVFYIGKGKGRRPWSRQGRNPWWRHVASKHGYTVEILRARMSAPCALTLERIIIRSIGVENLTNLVDGGGGVPGWRHSEDARAKIAAASRGRKLTEKAARAIGDRTRGTKLSPDHRAKLAAAKAGKSRGPMPADVRAKIAASHHGIRPSDESRAKMRDAHIGQRTREQNNKFNATIMVFEHPTHGIFEGYQYDLRVRFGIGCACVRAIVSGKQKTAKGWRFIKKKETENV
jgi:hypothetical protein